MQPACRLVIIMQADINCIIDQHKITMADAGDQYQAVLAHVIPDANEEESDEEVPARSNTRLGKLRYDVDYFLRLAGEENKWNYKMERISGSEAEDMAQDHSSMMASIAECRKLFDKRNDKTKAKRKPEVGLERPAKKTKLEVRLEALRPIHAPQLQRGSGERSVVVEQEPVDLTNKSEVKKLRLKTFEEIEVVQEALAAAIKSFKVICELERIGQEEHSRRMRQLVKICNRAVLVVYRSKRAIAYGL